MIRAISLAILIVINFVLQSTIFGFHDLGSITPNLLLILTMSFGLMRGRREGMLIGFFSGLLVDCFFTSVLGPYMFLYMIIGYVNGFFHKNYMVEDVLLPLIVIIIDDFFFNVIVYLISFLLKNRLEFGTFFTNVILPEMLCTALLTIIVYKIYVFINKLLKRKEES
ncbi:MAG: rod shape-determining protein MreD [Lachnospiraceae bacterium]|nr:rod shape-determining protein MreD [Lachnospiraceae bacterium]